MDMKAKCSIEMLQDMHSNFSLIRGLTRSSITEEEIAHWQALNQRIEDSKFVIGARIQTKDFSEEELALYSRLYERYPGGMIIRTADPTEEEIKDWKVWYEKINKMNLAEIRKKVQFFGGDDEEPYKDYGTSEEASGPFKDVARAWGFDSEEFKDFFKF